MSVEKLEASLPERAILTAYSGFRAKFGSAPADYEQVLVYADAEDMLRLFKPTRRKKRNLLVLTPDEHLQRLSEDRIAPVAQIYVDLWQLGAPASRFVDELERRFAGAPAKALEEAVKELKRIPEPEVS